MDRRIRCLWPISAKPAPAGVFSALHHIPYGELWPREAIRERKALIEASGLRWSAVESVPVHEGIKIGCDDLGPLFYNYVGTLRNLAAEGIDLVIYNFMPVLDWVRTEMRHKLPDGSECLYFDPVHFAAFEMFALRRSGAENDYTATQRAAAESWWQSMGEERKITFILSIIDVFPGVKWGLTIKDIRAMLARYEGMKPDDLRTNLARFLEAVIPAAEEAGVRMAIHPDDPPFPILGLPRIVSTAADIEKILSMVPSSSNGLCFCTGSFGARADNDLPAMATRFAEKIHAVHLRSSQRLPDGSFYEADHLGGSVDMPAVAQVLLREQARRRKEGRLDWQLLLRPDHGHTMMDDLGKPPGNTPGYSCIGRMRGLAELRGLIDGPSICGEDRYI